MTPAIEVEAVWKNFGATAALQGVSLRVESGKIFGLLGPNGAGKTTLVRLLTTLERPDRGRATVAGLNVADSPAAVRRVISVAGQYAALDQDISGRENLYLVARLLNLPPRTARARADEMLERFTLTEAAGRPVKGWSGGMRRRLDLAVALVVAPRVLFLDEPTTGLDPRSRNALWEVVRELAAGGVSVLLTTQQMEEAQALAEEIAVLDRGQVVASGTPDRLRAQVGGQVLTVRPTDPGDLPRLEAALNAVGPARAGCEPADQVVRLPVLGGELTAAMRALADSWVALAEVDTRVPSLDEVFLTLTAAVPAGGLR